MKLSHSFLLISTWCGLAITAPLQESFSAQQLIGSHFGIPNTPATYDYVILGGGTAGLALARRLAADSRYTVAVVNAGDFAEFANGNYSEIPAYASVFGGSEPILKNPVLDWEQYTTSQPQLNGRTIFYPSGKVLGGASSRNYMWFPRASIGSLKKWAQVTGDNAYLFENLLPFYKKVSTFTPPNKKTRLANATALYNPGLYGNGPVQASYSNWANPISSWLQKGLEALGYQNLAGGLADGNLWGYGYPASTIDPKMESRSSSEASYLREALQQTTNLNVYKNTLAKKIVFDGNKKATGAIVESGGAEYQLTANKEVIVSAGFARSPQLLMVSGIGPANTLKGLGISVISDLPGVGQNMWDHAIVAPTYDVSVLTHNSFSDPSIIAQHTELYRNSLTGLLTNNGGDILAFGRLPNGSISKSTQSALDSFSTDWPHIMFMFLDAYLGLNKAPPIDAPAGNYATPMMAITAPFSRGNITITSTDTSDNPIVSPNWLLDPRDQEMAIAAFKRARQLMTQKVMSAVVGAEAFPGTNVQSDSDILSVLRSQAFSSYHGSCTCAMGLKSNPMSVLDSKARVYGVTGLRVVDASSFPVLPPGTPQHTVYALAEKIANDILTGS